VTCQTCSRGKHLVGCNGKSAGTCEEGASSVSCGNHVASSCAQCPQGHGAGWCNGVCTWDHNDNSCKLIPINCVMTSWKNYGGCDKTCGDGSQMQKRTIHTGAAHGGRACPTDTTRQIKCNLINCPPGTCVDTPGWYDSDGTTWNCVWYAKGSHCTRYGDWHTNFGQTANQACCACKPRSKTSQKCSKPSITHGDVQFSDLISGTATYKCNPGYILVGPAVRICIQGKWDKVQPSCAECSDNSEYCARGKEMDFCRYDHFKNDCCKSCKDVSLSPSPILITGSLTVSNVDFTGFNTQWTLNNAQTNGKMYILLMEKSNAPSENELRTGAGASGIVCHVIFPTTSHGTNRIDSCDSLIQGKKYTLYAGADSDGNGGNMAYLYSTSLDIPHPINCVMTSWKNYGCDKTCGDGSQMETRTIHTDAAHGGRACPTGTTRQIKCNLINCPPVWVCNAGGEVCANHVLNNL